MAQTDPPWLPGCMANIKQLGGTLCSQQHCTDAQSYSHAVCYCQQPYPNGCQVPSAGCCSYTATSPIYVAQTGGGCYCCCGCFSNDTPVAINAQESRPIAEILIGDLVYVADNIAKNSWTTKTVQFSSGTGSMNSGNIMIKIDFGVDAGNSNSLFVTQNQVFYQPGGQLIRANKLVPGVNKLVKQDGSTVEIIQMTVGQYEKGIHHIATSQGVATSMDGHLILANGIVCGDFALQLVNIPDHFVAGHDKLPEFGTKEYLAKHKNLPDLSMYKASIVKPATGTKASGDGVYRSADSKKFTPFGKKEPVHIPGKANHFITEVQAGDILKNAPQWPITSGAGQDMYNYQVKLFKGFYPGITFYLDLENCLPNAYSFVEYGIPIIVINGGLIRTECVGFELLALVIGHEIGHLYGGDPKGMDGYTCEGMADFVAISSVFSYIWFGMYSSRYTDAAIVQVQTFFNFIDPKHRGGKTGSRCNDISIDCRMKSLNAAANTLPLPYCAGGNADPFLEVTGASAAGAEQLVEVTVSYNVPVNTDTATSLGNYAFTPKAAAYSVAMSDDPSKVIITVSLEAEREYKVSAYNVLSANNEPLVSGKNYALFVYTPEIETGTGKVMKKKTNK
jgi:hypothetical protein